MGGGGYCRLQMSALAVNPVQRVGAHGALRLPARGSRLGIRCNPTRGGVQYGKIFVRKNLVWENFRHNR